MDTSKAKGLSQSLGRLKDYSTLIIAIVIAIIAAGLFVVTPLVLGKSLAKQVASESLATGKGIAGFESRGGSSVVQLKQVEIEKQRQDKFAEDANKIALFSVHSSQRELLSYMLFPSPKDSSLQIFEDYCRNFSSGIEAGIASLNAGTSPTKTEISDATAGMNTSRTFGRRSNFGYYGSRKSESVRKVEDAICKSKAASFSIYAAPSDISGYTVWKDRKIQKDVDELLMECWDWQLGYWIFEDVVSTVGSLNSGSASVFDSPVKRIIALAFTKYNKSGGLSSGYSLLARSSGGVTKRGEGDDKPTYIVSTQEGITESCSRRICNDDIDVVHFDIVVVVRSDMVFPFMRELCSSKSHVFRGFNGDQDPVDYVHNQITVLEYNISPVVKDSSKHEYYRYGDDSTVELDLICEYVFDSKGYDRIMPKQVREALTKRKENAAASSRFSRGRGAAQ